MTQAKRGRPRQYDRDEALQAAIGAFNSLGFSATSLDQLVDAMGMNRPSIYHAFGDKQAVYRAALTHFIAQLRAVLAQDVAQEPDLEAALRSLYLGALGVYFAEAPARGCFVFCTAPVEALKQPEVGAIMNALIDELDGLLARKFSDAQAAGAYPPDTDPHVAAQIAQATLHSLALRARAGASHAELERMAHGAARVLSAKR